jgi:hypothetical protein
VDAPVGETDGAGQDGSPDVAPGDGGPSSDGASADGSSSDGAGDGSTGDTPPSPCNLQAPFGTPTPVPGLPNEIYVHVTATFSPNELTTYFSRTPGDLGSWDIYVATRASRNDPFGDATLLTALSTTQNDFVSSVSSDGLALYFHSDTGRGDGRYQIFVATRSDLKAAFSSPMPVTAVNGGTATSIDNDAFVTAAGDALYFASPRSANGDIYASPIAGGVVGTPVKVPGVNSATVDVSPVVSADGRTIFWASDRPDGNAKGAMDIWTASRSSTSADFASPKNVAELNSLGDEWPRSISPDGCRLYFEEQPDKIYTSTVMVAERPR